MEPVAAPGPAHAAPVAGPNGRERRRLRNYLLNAPLQLRLASYLIGVGVVLSLGLGLLLWRAYQETRRVIAPSGRGGPRARRQGEGRAAPLMRPRVDNAVLLLAVLAGLPACSSCDTVPAGALVSCQTTEVLPASVSTDILFVIDDSGSMSEE